MDLVKAHSRLQRTVGQEAHFAAKVPVDLTPGYNPAEERELTYLQFLSALESKSKTSANPVCAVRLKLEAMAVEEKYGNGKRVTDALEW